MFYFWERLFDRKDINAQVIALNRSILNESRNYVPNKHVTVNDKDPVWMNETIKSKVKGKNEVFKQYIQNGRFESDSLFFETLTRNARRCNNCDDLLQLSFTILEGQYMQK